MGVVRLRFIALLAGFGVSAVAACYATSAPITVGVLVPAMALVAVVALTRDRWAAVITAVVAAAAFLYVEIATVAQPLRVAFGTNLTDMSDIVRAAEGGWVPGIVGLAALLGVVPVAELVQRSLAAGEAPAERAPAPTLRATFVRVRVRRPPGAKRRDQASHAPLAEILRTELRVFEDTVTVMELRTDDVLIVLLDEDEQRTQALVERLDHVVHTTPMRPLECTVVIHDAIGKTRETVTGPEEPRVLHLPAGTHRAIS